MASRITAGVGLEIAPGAVRAAVVERSEPRLRLADAYEEPCEAATPSAIVGALTRLRSRLPPASPVVLGIPGTAAILAGATPLLPNPRRAILAVEFEVQQLLPFPLTEAAWHFQWAGADDGRRSGLGARGAGRVGRSLSPQPPAPSPERSSGVVVAAMRRSLLEERLAWCRQAGLSVQAVSLTPLGTLNALRLIAPSPAAPVLVLRVLDEQSAEWILWGPGLLQVVPVTSPAADGLGPELVTSWEGLRGHGPALPDRVWGMGASAAWPRFAETFSQIGVTLQPWPVGEAIAMARSLDRPERFAAAVGLAAQAVGAARLSLNLLTSSQQQEQARQMHRVGTVASGLFGLAAVGLGLSGMLEVRQRRLGTLTLLEQREQLYQSLRPEVRSLIQHQQHLEQRTVQLERFVLQGAVLTKVLADVADALPDDVWLTTASWSKTDELIDGTLEGHANTFQDVTRFFDRLKTVARMTSVKPLSTSVTTQGERELIVFSVQIQRPIRSEAGQ